MTSCGVAILGSTGSIGRSTLDVVERHPDRFRVVALSARRDVARLFDQCVRHRPLLAVMTEGDAARELSRRLAVAGVPTEVMAGDEALIHAATAAGARLAVSRSRTSAP